LEIAMPSQKVIHDPNRPPAAPIEYAGQWVAWNRKHVQIVAHGADVATVRAAAIAAGHAEAILQKVRRPGAYIGAPTTFLQSLRRRSV
jgi:hypothetical protein